MRANNEDGVACQRLQGETTRTVAASTMQCSTMRITVWNSGGAVWSRAPKARRTSSTLRQVSHTNTVCVWRLQNVGGISTHTHEINCPTVLCLCGMQNTPIRRRIARNLQGVCHVSEMRARDDPWTEESGPPSYREKFKKIQKQVSKVQGCDLSESQFRLLGSEPWHTTS